MDTVKEFIGVFGLGVLVGTAIGWICCEINSVWPLRISAMRKLVNSHPIRPDGTNEPKEKKE